MKNHTKTTIDRLRNFLRLAMAIRKPVHILSNPGLGKTQEVTAFAAEAKADLFVLVASLLDRLDLAGLPRYSKLKFGDKEVEATTFAPMETIVRLSNEYNPTGGPAVLYFNEFNAAPESVMPVLYRLVCERRINDLSLRDNVMIVADGNPSSAMSAGRDLQMAMRRRFMWVTLDVAVEPWNTWAYGHGIDGRVIAFFKVPAFLKHFCDFDPAKAREVVTYSCPASWENLSTALQGLDDLSAGGTVLSEEDRLVLYTGLVGQSAGTAFHGFLKFQDKIPNVHKALENPDAFKLPEGVEMRALLVGSILNLVRKNLALVPAAATIAHRMFKAGQGHTEYGVFLLRSMASIPLVSAKVTGTPAFKAMAVALTKESELLGALLAAPAKPTP